MFVALVIQLAKRRRCIVLPSVARPALSYFLHYLINDTIFGKVLLNTTCVLIFSTNLSETFLILRGIKRYTNINGHRSSCEVLAILVIFQWNLNFLERFSKNSQITNFMKIRPVGDGRTEGRTNRQTDRHAMANSANATSQGGPEVKWGSTMASGDVWILCLSNSMKKEVKVTLTNCVLDLYLEIWFIEKKKVCTLLSRAHKPRVFVKY